MVTKFALLEAGGGTIKVHGIVYFPNHDLRIAGGGMIGDKSSQFAVIADAIEFKGNGTLEIRIGAGSASAGLPELPQPSETVGLTE